MKIRDIRAVEIDITPRPKTAPREPIRAIAMNRARPLDQKSAWGPPSRWKTVACVVTVEDGSWGLGISLYGKPVVSVINDHFALLLVGESCMADRAAARS